MRTAYIVIIPGSIEEENCIGDIILADPGQAIKIKIAHADALEASRPQLKEITRRENQAARETKRIHRNSPPPEAKRNLDFMHRAAQNLKKAVWEQCLTAALDNQGVTNYELTELEEV